MTDYLVDKTSGGRIKHRPPLALTPERMQLMAERVEHPYECQAKGHQEGSRTFLAAPPEWFAAKGMSTPKNCKPCRDWINGQVDEMLSCACGSKIRLSARSKISHFKKVGPYEPVTECRSCREGKRPPKGIERRPDKEERTKHEKEKRTREFKELRIDSPPEPRTLITDRAFYDAQVTNNYKTGLSETRTEHFEHHLVGSPNSWTTEAAAMAAGLSKPSSPTCFAAEGQTVEELLEFTASYALATNSENVREYVIDAKRIVRVTFTGDHDGLEKTILARQNDGSYGLVTTHDNVTVEDIVGQTWYKGR